MLGDVEDETWKLFCNDRASFINAIVNTRNHFTHYSTKQGRKILQGVDLHWAIQKLSLMLRLLLLSKSGVPESVLQEAIRSNWHLSRERNAWKSMSEDGSEYGGMESD
jgi:hypothetical protein